MYARVARFEHADPEALRRATEEMRRSVAANDGPPEGVPSNGVTMLVDPENGRCLMIGFFETEDDLRQGDEALNRMSPPSGDAAGRRTTVEMYEVGVDVRMPEGAQAEAAR